jgi:hypothetical protein
LSNTAARRNAPRRCFAPRRACEAGIGRDVAPRFDVLLGALDKIAGVVARARAQREEREGCDYQ